MFLYYIIRKNTANIYGAELPFLHIFYVEKKCERSHTHFFSFLCLQFCEEAQQGILNLFVKIL